MYSAIAFADIPPPGSHGNAKRFANVSATIQNVSPLAFDGRPIALTADHSGGVWFGLGNTIEHIDREYRVTSMTLSPWWAVGGMDYDRKGRLWFSFRQSGRIGTLVDGRLETRVVVPRHEFPDLGAIAFDRSGGLWFVDPGRRSIGRRAPDGVVTERPVPDSRFPAGLVLCGKSPIAYIAANGERADGGALIVATNNLSMRNVREWTSTGFVSVACDRSATVHFAYASFQSTSLRGKLRSSRIIEATSPVDNGERLFSTEDGAVISAGQAFRLDGNRRLRIERVGDRRTFVLTLPIDGADTVTQTKDGTIWIGISRPHSIVRVRPDR